MITRDNIKSVLEELNPKIIEGVLNKPGDYILMEVHIFNAGHSTMLKSMDYDEDTDQEASANGQLFCDKDDFIRLLEENNINYEA